MVRNVKVTTASSTALLVSWDALQDSYLSRYTIYYSAFFKKLNKVVDNFTKVIPSTYTSHVVNIRELTDGVVHRFQVTASLMVDGKLYAGEKPVPVMKIFGKGCMTSTSQDA